MRNQSCATSRMFVACTVPTSIDGSALPAMISAGRNGVTSNWSNVPCSRSRATDMAVSSSVCIMVSVPIRLGIMFQRVSRLGLYQARLDHLDRRPGLAVVRLPVGVERLDDGADVAHGDAGGVGVAAVGDHLHVGRQPGEQPPLEVLADLDHEQGALLVDARSSCRPARSEVGRRDGTRPSRRAAASSS